MVGSDFAGDFKRNLGAVDIKNRSGPVACRRQQHSKIEQMDGKKMSQKPEPRQRVQSVFVQQIPTLLLEGMDPFDIVVFVEQIRSDIRSHGIGSVEG